MGMEFESLNLSMPPVAPVVVFCCDPILLATKFVPGSPLSIVLFSYCQTHHCSSVCIRRAIVSVKSSMGFDRSIMNTIRRRTSELRIMLSSFSLLELAPMRSRIACDDVVPINGRLLPCSERRDAVFPAGLVSALAPPGAPSCCFIGCDCEKSAWVSTKEESKRYCCCCCFLCPKDCIGLVLDVRIRDGWRRVGCGSFACWPAQGAKPYIP